MMVNRSPEIGLGLVGLSAALAIGAAAHARYAGIASSQPRPRSFPAVRDDRTRIYGQSIGNQALEEFMHCFYCGGKMPPDARYCRICGREQRLQP